MGLCEAIANHNTNWQETKLTTTVYTSFFQVAFGGHLTPEQVTQKHPKGHLEEPARLRHKNFVSNYRYQYHGLM